MESLEQPSGMPSEQWIALLLRTAKEVSDGIAVSEHEDGRPEQAIWYQRVSDDISDALANPVLRRRLG